MNNNSKISTVCLGYPCIGGKRELKKALEGYWKGDISSDQLRLIAFGIKRGNWNLQKENNITNIVSNDFSYYDRMLDTSAMFGVIPKRFKWNGDKVDLDLYFSIARGIDDIPASDMTKWFDTNYHYIVPEFEKNQEFTLSTDKTLSEYNEGKSLRFNTCPVLIGPLTYLMLGKPQGDFNSLDLIDKILPMYKQIIAKLKTASAKQIQFDEPCLSLNLDEKTKKIYKKAYKEIRGFCDGMKIMLVTYFGDLKDNTETALSLPVDTLHVDLISGDGKVQLDKILKDIPENLSLSLGLVNGRNVWKNDLENSFSLMETTIKAIGKERTMIGGSCSYLHSPYDLDTEDELNPDVKKRLSFAKQKLIETKILAEGFEKKDTILKEFKNDFSTGSKKKLDIKKEDAERKSSFKERQKKQKKVLNLPLFPTTTIGSFPQTKQVRKMRASFRKKKISDEKYEEFLKEETKKAIKIQEDIGLDVFVHGEFERTDMVEYFGQLLDGFAFSKNGWVQSYGSRCVKPPIIYTDVEYVKKMTVKWSKFAQSLTKKPVKGMLTGPITILKWSFTREDISREDICKQIALALRKEICHLEEAGIKIIQVDEPGLREGLPLRKEQMKEYLDWTVFCFKLACGGVKDETQIHTHMCYAEFDDIIESIGKMDADVISMEASRSQMNLLNAFIDYKYPNDIGPGMYDIHSPIIPTQKGMEELIKKACKRLSPKQLWINPDCGLKTRNWSETIDALKNMVKAAKKMRKEFE